MNDYTGLAPGAVIYLGVLAWFEITNRRALKREKQLSAGERTAMAPTIGTR